LYLLQGIWYISCSSVKPTYDDDDSNILCTSIK